MRGEKPFWQHEMISSLWLKILLTVKKVYKSTSELTSQLLLDKEHQVFVSFYNQLTAY